MLRSYSVWAGLQACLTQDDKNRGKLEEPRAVPPSVSRQVVSMRVCPSVAPCRIRCIRLQLLHSRTSPILVVVRVPASSPDRPLIRARGIGILWGPRGWQLRAALREQPGTQHYELEGFLCGRPCDGTGPLVPMPARSPGIFKKELDIRGPNHSNCICFKFKAPGPFHPNPKAWNPRRRAQLKMRLTGSCFLCRNLKKGPAFCVCGLQNYRVVYWNCK